MITSHTDTSSRPVRSNLAEKKPAAATEAAIDAELVRRFNSGDEPAFNAIMQRYHGKIFALALGLIRNHADAEEIAQDTFIRAHRGLVNFRGDSSLATWLHRIAVNLSRNRYWYFHRRHRQDMLSLDCEIGAEGDATFAAIISDPEQDPAQHTVANEFTTLVEACLAKLEPRHREILLLRNTLNHSYDEIATALGLNVGTVKSRIARARENLRMLLAAKCPEFAPDAEPDEWFLPARALYGHPVIASP